MRTGYQDIKDHILHQIRSNVWTPGTLLPGEIDLAESFGCARATVSRAMRELVDEGILERKRKAGTRVKSSPTRRAQFAIPIIRTEIEDTGAPYRYDLVERHVLPAPNWLRSRLDLPESASVLHLKCMHYQGNTPYQFEDRWINLAAVPQAESYAFKDIGPNEWLVQEVPFTDGNLEFSATNATEDIAAFLGAPVNAALFTVERTTWLADVSVTFARLYFARDYKMTTRL
ncbi:GntR family transcriptional regulator [Amylibacter sp. IMCC11727]|uniref:GntR family transcriptional regulator n=1 Tax=Amylibacter sp. IMCC11727 TaxID=3039851 RepID=UPI00244E1548|nr:GntR family transcriptional regulator [Amylibacter sp. IMCC11727]WGI23080.1 GntR family transcriptional regulator [Amylibacter sp. IMCC11727]